MGLDAVELIVGVEEAFDIEIPDQDAEKLIRVGQMYAYVVGRLAFSPRRCPSSAVFYRTRRALMDRYGAARRSITPSTPMEAVLPSRQHRAHWQELSQAMELQLPVLQLPRWMARLSTGMALALLVVCLAAYLVYPLSLALLYSIMSALAVWSASRALASCATRIPAECATVGGTVRAALRLNYGVGAQARRKWDPNEVWETLRSVIVEQLGVPPEAVTTDASFVDDLGAG